ncbi:DUF1672 family protein [Listeria costaricensis]|uniref:DUF1672 family protein n=1 Tax=Listeria costaricensis TaxID=2026604 RepID=UPI00308436B2
MKKIIVGLLASILFIGGCSDMNEKTAEEKLQEGTTPVQDYVGQGFSFVDGDKSEELVKKKEEEIKQVAIDYVKTTYKTNVKVNNVVPARGAAVVMVECEAPIQFHTSVIVGLDMRKGTVGDARSDEGEVEKAIVGGLYAKAYEEKFQHLDEFAAKLAQEYDLLGMTEEAIDKTSSVGYEKEYYFISTSDSYYPSVYNAYLANPEISADELCELFMQDDPANENISIPMDFYIEENKLPKQELINDMAGELRQEQGLPKGNYSIVVYKESRRLTGWRKCKCRGNY